MIFDSRAADERTVIAIMRHDAAATESAVCKRLQRVAHCVALHAALRPGRVVDGCRGTADRLCGDVAIVPVVRVTAAGDED